MHTEEEILARKLKQTQANIDALMMKADNKVSGFDGLICLMDGIKPPYSDEDQVHIRANSDSLKETFGRLKEVIDHITQDLQKDTSGTEGHQRSRRT